MGGLLLDTTRDSRTQSNRHCGWVVCAMIYNTAKCVIELNTSITRFLRFDQCSSNKLT